MNHRTKNLAIAGGAVAAIAFVGMNVLMTSAPPAPAVVGVAPEPSAPGLGGATPTAGGSSVPSVAPSPERPGSTDRRSYAVGLADLAGLPPDATPGAVLELWVTWEPPVTDEPRLQKLIGDVVLERIVPGVVPEAPVTALLSVPADRVGDLMYADGFGRLSVALPD